MRRFKLRCCARSAHYHARRARSSLEGSLSNESVAARVLCHGRISVADDHFRKSKFPRSEHAKLTARAVKIGDSILARCPWDSVRWRWRRSGRRLIERARARGWHGLFGRGRRGLSRGCHHDRGLGVTTGGYVFFFPRFLRFRFIGPALPIAAGTWRDFCSPLSSLAHPSLYSRPPSVSSRDREAIYLIGPLPVAWCLKLRSVQRVLS